MLQLFAFVFDSAHDRFIRFTLGAVNDNFIDILAVRIWHVLLNEFTNLPKQ